MSKRQNKKSKFRASSTWKAFRARLKKERKVDEITLSPLYSGFNVHHMVQSGHGSDEDSYEDLSNPNNFRTYNRMTHKFIEWLFPYYRKDETILERIKRDLDEMKQLYRV